MSTIDILVTDDQNFVRKTIESYLESEPDLNIVGFAENGELAIEQVSQLKPDVVLMDIEMPIMDGFSATEIITKEYADTKVLILSIRDREQDVARALQLGAKGYWLKNTTAKELADAIRHVHNGYFQLALELVNKHFSTKEKPDRLEQQELELSNKLRIVDTVLAQIEQKINSFEELTPRNLNQKVETIVKQEMFLKREKDANLQFKYDRLKSQLARLETKTSSAIAILAVCNVILLSALIALGYWILNR